MMFIVITFQDGTVDAWSIDDPLSITDGDYAPNVDRIDAVEAVDAESAIKIKKARWP